MSKNDSSIHLEKALSELENLVEKMESNELSLEESMQLFEKGVKLTKQCQTTLTQAEQKVQRLTQSTDNATLTNFEEGTQE